MATYTTTNCTFCLEDATSSTTVLVAGGDKVCEQCVKDNIIPKFEEALRFEHHYPVRWGQTELLPEQFHDYITGDFLDQWSLKVIEYKTDPEKRVYCKNANSSSSSSSILSRIGALLPVIPGLTTISECGRFLGASDKLQCEIKECVCGGKTCGTCLQAIGAAHDHTCDEKVIAASADDSIGFQGLQRGKDYQICPGHPETTCGMRVSLQDGCNHMTCERCRAHFCYICGERADARSGHWDTGTPCPHYNQPGSEDDMADQARAEQVRVQAEQNRIRVEQNRAHAEEDLPALRAMVSQVWQIRRTSPQPPAWTGAFVQFAAYLRNALQFDMLPLGRQEANEERSRVRYAWLTREAGTVEDARAQIPGFGALWDGYRVRHANFAYLMPPHVQVVPAPAPAAVGQ